MIAGEEQPVGLRPQADVAERMAGRVQDFPLSVADGDDLAALQAGGCLDDGVQVRHPRGERVGEIGQVGGGHAVVAVGVALSRLRGVGVPILLAVQVRHGVHEQLGTGEFHQPPAMP